MHGSGAGSLALALLIAAPGCVSGDYAYRPERENGVAASYGVPPELPRGAVRVAAPGIVELRRGAEQPMRAMHLRLLVENGSNQAWSLDSREQIGVLGPERSRPAFASASRGSPPIVEVPPRSGAVIDLYYPLPRDAEPTHPQGFDLIWCVQTPDERVTRRTSFDRVEKEPVPAPAAGWNYGWGPTPGWYDPFWPEYTFEGATAPPSR